MDETKECPECGAENEEAANVCVDCGTDLAAGHDDMDTDEDDDWETMDDDDWMDEDDDDDDWDDEEM